MTRILLAVALLCASVTGALASDGFKLAAFSAWLTNKTEYPTPSAPEIVRKSDKALWWMMQPGVPFPENPADGRVHGLYIDGTIYLAETCGDSAWCDSVLLHELVHHYQSESGVDLPCLGEQEREAYQIQEKWLAERGVDIWDHLDPLWTVIVWQIGCGVEGIR
jgi:hypothetical protein